MCTVHKGQNTLVQGGGPVAIVHSEKVNQIGCHVHMVAMSRSQSRCRGEPRLCGRASAVGVSSDYHPRGSSRGPAPVKSVNKPDREVSFDKLWLQTD